MIPKKIRPFLWSYDIKELDLEKNKERIITNILNLGSREATDWLFKNYSKKDIKKIVISPNAGEWNKKSLNYWSLVFNLNPPKILKRKLS